MENDDKQLAPEQGEEKQRPARKPTKAETSKRVSEVVTLLAECASRHQIVQYGREKWGAGEAVVEKIITKAYREFTTHANETRNHAIELHIARLEDIARAAREAENFSCAVGALNAIASIRGFNAPRRAELSGTNGGPVAVQEMSPEDIQRFEETLRASILLEAGMEPAKVYGPGYGKGVKGG